MILPKKLQPVSETELLKEVSEELNIPLTDVNRTFDIWIQYLDHIANETDQATITIPKVGQMYVSVPKLRRSGNVGKVGKFRERKLNEIEKLRDKCLYIVHEKVVPIILKYGLSRRNKKGKKDERGFNEFFSSRDLINNQVEKFFNDDVEFSERKNLKKYFITENDE